MITDEQIKNIEKVLKYKSKNVLNDFLDAVIKAGGDKEFLERIRESEFFNDFFLKGFIEGIKFEKKCEDIKWIV